MDRVRVVFEKWGGRPHWEYDALRLGGDDHGTWLGLPVGTEIVRPGAGFATREPQVVLVSGAQGFVASYHREAEGKVDVYVDITTVPVIEEDVVRAVDLDLDVVRGWTGRVWVDDEDEFADHRKRFGYPEATVRAAVDTCERVRDLVEGRDTPFDAETPERWFTLLQQA